MLTVEWLKFILQLTCLFGISVWMRNSPSLQSFKSNSSLLSKHSTTTTFAVLRLSAQCSSQKLSLSFTKPAEISCFSSSLLFMFSSQYLCISQYFERGRPVPYKSLTCFIQEKPRGYLQLLWWESWQALEVAAKTFREIVTIKFNNRQQPPF